MNKSILFGLAAVALMAVVAIEPTFAQATASGSGGTAAQAGSTAAQTMIGVITGNIGLLIGLGVTLLGLWTWIIGQKTGPGLVMVIGGVLITMTPGLFSGARNMLSGVVQQFGGSPYSVNAVQ